MSKTLSPMQVIIAALHNLVVGLSSLVGMDAHEDRRITKLVRDAQEVTAELEDIWHKMTDDPIHGKFHCADLSVHTNASAAVSALTSAAYARRFIVKGGPSHAEESVLMLPIASLDPRANTVRCHDLATYSFAEWKLRRGRCDVCSRAMSDEFPEFAPISVYGHRESDHLKAPTSMKSAVDLLENADNPWIEASRRAMHSVIALQNAGLLNLLPYHGEDSEE